LQENLLLSGSIASNIAIGDPKPEFERIRKAAKNAGAHDFICRLPQAYDTHVGEMGLTLSVGERQRISIARAIYRNPRIVIFDEATSALDITTELRILEDLTGILEGRTTLFISHKKSTIGFADRVLLLEDGIVVEKGSIEENSPEWATSRPVPIRQFED
jgi:subfamily B ATP-binding cassette protein HlyB/CyaB